MANNLEFIDSVNSTSTITTVTFDNIFSSKYDNYYLTVTGFEPALSEELGFRLINSSGSVLNGTNYDSASYTLSTSATFSEVQDQNKDKWRYGGYAQSYSNTGIGVSMYIYNPFNSSSHTYAFLASSQGHNQYIGRKVLYVYKVAESTRGLEFTNNGNYNMDILTASIYGVK